MPDATELLRQLQSGDDDAFGPLFEAERQKLVRMVQFRLDRRLHGRVDPEDVVQEIFVAAQRRLWAYRKDPRSLPMWLRLIGQQTLIDVHRHHFGRAMRDAAQERAFAQSHALSQFFAASITSPSQAAMRHELRERLEAALQSMEEIDREVLTLRHFEELTNKEVAELLDIGENAASNRYVRALVRLKGILGEPGPS